MVEVLAYKVKTIELRDGGHPLIILTEQEWVRFI
jgi:hypothetical protein